MTGRPRNQVLNSPKIKRKPGPRNSRSSNRRAKATSTAPPQVENKLVDSLRPDLTLVFVGLNPGLTTAQTGHAYAHPSNRFWPLLHESGITPIRHQPRDTRALMDLYSIGNTNIVSRPSRDGSSLTAAELAEGAALLETKIRAFRPEAVAIVGKSIWEAIWLAKTGRRMKKEQFRYGWQDESMNLGRMVGEDQQQQQEEEEAEWPGARTFVTTTTSGLAAGMSPSEKLEVWKPLGEWVRLKRGGG